MTESSVEVHQSAARRRLRSTVKGALRGLGYELRKVDTSFFELQRELLRTCDLVVDVGANAGQYGQLVRSLGYRGLLRSFEPEEAAYAVLRRNADSDVLWETRRVALSDHVGSGVLNVSANSVSSSLLTIRREHVSAAPASAVDHVADVPLSTLDAEVGPEPGRRIWLKMDVQGAEMSVLRGGSQVLRSVQVVQAELSLRSLYQEQTDYLELLGLLRTEGFVVAHLLPGFRDPGTKHLLQADVLAVRAGGTATDR